MAVAYIKPKLRNTTIPAAAENIAPNAVTYTPLTLPTIPLA